MGMQYTVQQQYMQTLPVDVVCSTFLLKFTAELFHVFSQTHLVYSTRMHICEAHINVVMLTNALRSQVGRIFPDPLQQAHWPCGCTGLHRYMWHSR